MGTITSSHNTFWTADAFASASSSSSVSSSFAFAFSFSSSTSSVVAPGGSLPSSYTSGGVFRESVASNQKNRGSPITCETVMNPFARAP